ncbi:Ethylene-responsive transcription factor ERF112, partial [Frankliniella fusca]
VEFCEMETSLMHSCCEPISTEPMRVRKHQQNTVKQYCSLLSVSNILDFMSGLANLPVYHTMGERLVIAKF